jgi:hypothetical protein
MAAAAAAAVDGEEDGTGDAGLGLGDVRAVSGGVGRSTLAAMVRLYEITV